MAGKTNTVSAEEALDRLKKGNERYTRGEFEHLRRDQARRTDTSSGQWPFAIVLTCADSRVTPELVFDQGIGDIFVARVAGNVASGEVIGSLQYAVKYIGTKLVVVLGHESCGAVGAAIEAPPGPPAELVALVGDIQRNIGDETELDKAVDKNANVVAEQLQAKLEGATVMAATYALESGVVRWR